MIQQLWILLQTLNHHFLWGIIKFIPHQSVKTIGYLIHLPNSSWEKIDLIIAIVHITKSNPTPIIHEHYSTVQVTATSVYLGVTDNSTLELARNINIWKESQYEHTNQSSIKIWIIFRTLVPESHCRIEWLSIQTSQNQRSVHMAWT